MSRIRQSSEPLNVTLVQAIALLIGWGTAVVVGLGVRVVLTSGRRSATAAERVDQMAVLDEITDLFRSGPAPTASEIDARVEDGSLSLGLLAARCLAQPGLAEPVSAVLVESDVIVRLASALSSAGDADKLVGTIETIRGLGLAGSVPGLAALAESPDATVRRAAVEAVASHDPDLAAGLLLSRLDRDGAWATELLSRLIASGRVSPSVIALSRAEPDVVAAMTQAQSCGSSDPFAPGSVDDATPDRDEALSALTRLIASPDQDVRLSTVTALGSIGSSGAMIVLLGLMDHPDRVTRFAAAAQLADSAFGRTLLEEQAVAGHGDAALAAVAVLRERSGPPSVDDRVEPFSVAEVEAVVNGELAV